MRPRASFGTVAELDAGDAGRAGDLVVEDVRLAADDRLIAARRSAS